MAKKVDPATCEHEWEKDRDPFGGADTGDDYCGKCGETVHRASRKREEDAAQAARRVVDEATGVRPKTRPQTAAPKKK